MEENRGSIAFFATFRPPVALDLFARPLPPTLGHGHELQKTDHGESSYNFGNITSKLGFLNKEEYKPMVDLLSGKLAEMRSQFFSRPQSSTTSTQDLELRLTDDEEAYNYNGQAIPPAALKTILKRRELASHGIYKQADVDSGRLAGMIFVSERGRLEKGNLETLHIALLFNDKTEPKVKVFSLAEVFGTSEFDGVRMEDSGCLAGDYLVYVSTKEPSPHRRQPWTAVYKTNVITGKTNRLTPFGQADLSPSVSPSGKKIAVASFERKGGWNGEIEDLKTDIFVMSVDNTSDRKLVVRNGGWPTWGSDNVIFFHRKVGEFWNVFRADISNGDVRRVTPERIDAITPAAIDSTTVAVATIRQSSKLDEINLVEDQYRHIEIFYSIEGKEPTKITRETRSKDDHFNPFVIDIGGNKHIGYHRGKNEFLKNGDNIPRKFYELDSPREKVGVFRVSGVFPTFSNDGKRLAFVDNAFKAVWVADDKGLHKVYETKGDNVFAPVWNQRPEKDVLYVCWGPSFSADKELNICAIPNVSKARQQRVDLTRPFINGFPSNNAFPSTSPDGQRLVFRSTRDWGKEKHKNLYIMDAKVGEYGEGKITRLTEGPWTDTHCQWAPKGDWIVFSSSRDKPGYAPDKDNKLDPGYFAVFLVRADKPSVCLRVMGSGDDLAGHVNHPFFSPDGRSIVVTADLAAVSADPISMPHFLHSVRPYGDIFTVDIDPNDIYKNENVKEFKRITHSRYENATGSWTLFSTKDSNAAWNQLIDKGSTPACPYVKYRDGGNLTGRLFIPKRC